MERSGNVPTRNWKIFYFQTQIERQRLETNRLSYMPLQALIPSQTRAN